MSCGNSSGGTSRRGFTILEAVVALAIISLVAVGTLAAVGAQLRSTEHAQRTTEAVTLAEERMTAVRLLAGGDPESLPDSIASGRFAPPLDRYTWRATVEPVSSEVGLHAVTVQIDWPDGAYTLASRMYHPTPVTEAPASDEQFGPQSGQGGLSPVPSTGYGGLTIGGGR